MNEPCIPAFLLTNRRLHKRLNGTSRCLLLDTLMYAALCGDVTRLSRRAAADLGIEILLSPKELQRRLTQWEDLEFIRRNPDGSISLLLVGEDDDSMDEDEDDDAPRVQSKRRYSENPNARRGRRHYHNARNGTGSHENGTGQSVRFLDATESKPNAFSAKSNAEMGKNLTLEPNIPRGRVNPNVQRYSENQPLVDKELTLNVSEAAKPNAQPHGPQSLSDQGSAPPRNSGRSDDAPPRNSGRSDDAPPRAPGSPGNPPPRRPSPPDQRRALLRPQVRALAEEFGTGNELRDYQLLGLAEEYGLHSLVTEATHATRKRMEQTFGDPLRAPHAYFDRTLVKLLDNHGVVVPTKADRAAVAAELGLAEGASAEDVRAAIHASLPPETLAPEEPTEEAAPPSVSVVAAPSVPVPARHAHDYVPGPHDLPPVDKNKVAAVLETEVAREKAAQQRRQAEADARRQKEAAR